MSERERTITNADNIAAWSAFPESVLEAFGDEGDFAHQYLLTPALLDLLGDVSGRQLLDAGAGNGYLSRKLARLGAIVTALEPAENPFRYMLERELQEPLGISCIQQDLSTMTQFDGQFDAVVANMVLLDIPDYQEAISNCVRALKLDGAFIFSIEHPSFDLADKSQLPVGVDDYFSERAFPRDFGHNFHRTLETYLDALADNGALVERIKEPRLSAELAEQHPERAWGRFVPAFMLIKAVKARS
jgi:SAM-dependent methyltransferase